MKPPDSILVSRDAQRGALGPARRFMFKERQALRCASRLTKNAPLVAFPMSGSGEPRHATAPLFSRQCSTEEWRSQGAALADASSKSARRQKTRPPRSLRIFSAAGALAGGFVSASRFPPARAPAALKSSQAPKRTVRKIISVATAWMAHTISDNGDQTQSSLPASGPPSRPADAIR